MVAFLLHETTCRICKNKYQSTGMDYVHYFKKGGMWIPKTCKKCVKKFLKDVTFAVVTTD